MFCFMKFPCFIMICLPYIPVLLNLSQSFVDAAVFAPRTELPPSARLK